MARKADYLFQRPGSQNWHIKLQYTGALAEKMGHKKLEKSLGTPDRAEAEILAMPMIEQHKRALLEQQRAQDFPVSVSERRYEPGREHKGSDGARIIATADDLIYLDANGTILRTEKNWVWCRVPLPSLQEQTAIVRRSSAGGDRSNLWVVLGGRSAPGAWRGGASREPAGVELG
jgi:hypothetical protein